MKAVHSAHETLYAAHQSEYPTLPALKSADVRGTILVRWKLTVWERILLLFGGILYHQVLTFDEPLQPICLDVAPPKEWLHRLEQNKAIEQAKKKGLVHWWFDVIGLCFKHLIRTEWNEELRDYVCPQCEVDAYDRANW